MQSQTVNNRLVLTLRNLILTIRGGITHHTEEVTNDVYQHFKDEGQTIDEVVKSTVNQRFKQDREDAQQASLSAQVSAKASQQNVDAMTVLLDSFVKFMLLIGIEMVIALTAVSLTPGWWKVPVALVLIFACGLSDVKYYQKKVIGNVI